MRSVTVGMQIDRPGKSSHPFRGRAKHCDKYVSLSVCLSVCLSIHSKTTRPIFTKFVYACWLNPPPTALFAIRYVLPVL